MKQNFYNRETVTKNFLGSYSSMRLYENRLVFVNTLTDEEVCILGYKDTLKQIADVLQVGVEDDVILALFASCNSDDCFALLLQKGMVE